jgi:poly-gamma-glutamate synthesis protein (capsule biosynthesis protein)
MTGRGVDQILPHPSSPEIFERMVHHAGEYVDLAEEAHGAIPHPVGFSYVWGEALAELEQLDALIINLETAVTRDGEPWPGKDVHYRMHADNVSCLSAAHVDVCGLANNHALDWGRDALVETLESLHQAGIKTAGAGRHRREAEEPATVDSRARRVVVFGLGDSSSGIPRAWAASSGRPGVALLREGSEREADAIGERIARVRRTGDVVVVSLHWGSNWGYGVADELVEFAHALVERGVDVIHGHSSHHPRPIEIHRGRLVLYGCGDFIDDYEGIVAHEPFRSDLVLAYLPRLRAATGELIELRMVPLRIRRMRLERASFDDTTWLATTLSRISGAYGSRIAATADGTLTLQTAQEPPVLG